MNIDQPGVYEMSAEEYHRDPVDGGSLSSSGARKLLACPAKYRYEQDHGQPHKKEFDFGHAAHRKVLGVGAEIVALDFPDFRTKAAKEAVQEVRAAGGIPLKVDDYERVEQMAEAIRLHDIAGPLFQPDRGVAEQVHVWADRTYGVWRRSMLDWQIRTAAGRLVVVDYKTTETASREAIRKSVASYGYHQQHAWYVDGAKALDLDDDPGFIFVFQEKTAPYLVNVVRLDDLAVTVGRERNEQAIWRYAECRRTGVWPGYGDDIDLISLPPWAVTSHLEGITA